MSKKRPSQDGLIPIPKASIPVQNTLLETDIHIHELENTVDKIEWSTPRFRLLRQKGSDWVGPWHLRSLDPIKFPINYYRDGVFYYCFRHRRNWKAPR